MYWVGVMVFLLLCLGQLSPGCYAAIRVPGVKRKDPQWVLDAEQLLAKYCLALLEQAKEIRLEFLQATASCFQMSG